MSTSYSQLPKNAAVAPEPFRLHVEDQAIEEFHTLLRLSKIGPVTWENQQQDRRFGITHEWLSKAKDEWLNRFNWRAQEERINSFPNFKTKVNDERGSFDVHFVALFSSKVDAIPIICMHGWPGSFLEFLPMMALLREKYTPETLPYHIIVPSLPGYTLSGGPPLDGDFETIDTARILNSLMRDLGFANGYLAHGGDVGSTVAQLMAMQFKECKARHVNMLPCRPSEGSDVASLPERERKALADSMSWLKTGTAYAMEHGTRPATIGLALSSNPLALLAWIGEKFLAWSDEDPPLEEILTSVSLYWYTSGYPRSLYPYRGFVKGMTSEQGLQFPKIEKPLGYSFFKDLMITPKEWAEKENNLVFFRAHDKGGHFAALEQPAALLEDIEDFAKKAW